MSGFLRDLREMVGAGLYTVIISVFFVLLIIGLTMLMLVFGPQLEKMRADMYRSSQPYSETALGQLSELVSAYDNANADIAVLEKIPGNEEVVKARKVQRDNKIREVCETVRKMNRDQVPDYIHRFLRNHSEVYVCTY